MNFFPQPCLSPSESARLGAKQGHAKSRDGSPLSHPLCGPSEQSQDSRVLKFHHLKSKIQNPRVSVSTPYSCRGRERWEKSKIRNCDVLTLTPSSHNPLIPRRLPAAFSLTEVVIAMGVAAVAFTSIIALFPLGLNMSKESYEATQAALIAQTILADVKDQQTGNGNQRVSSSPWNTKLIQIASNSDPINVLTNYATVMIDRLTPQIVYIAYKPFVGTGNDTDTNNPAMLRPSTGIYAAAAPNWYSTGSNGATMLVKVTFTPTIMVGSATSTSTPRRVDVSVETPGSANISNRTCYLFTGAIRP